MTKVYFFAAVLSLAVLAKVEGSPLWDSFWSYDLDDGYSELASNADMVHEREGRVWFEELEDGDDVEIDWLGGAHGEEPYVYRDEEGMYSTLNIIYI